MCERLARDQHHVVAYRQLRAAGMSHEAIRHAVRTRRLFVVYRGVYAVGRRELTREGRWMAAVLACGNGALLSHRPAGLAWLVLERGDERPHVTVPGRRRGPAGVRVHQVDGLRPATRLRIPVTSLTDTLVDLAGDLDPHALKAAVRQAVRVHALDLRDLRDEVAEPASSWKKARLRRLCDLWVPNVELTQSELEARFFELCARGHLRMPAVQRPFGPYRSDFVWEDVKLVVETDGRDHDTAVSRLDDRVRDRALVAAGYTVLRFTWTEIVNRPAQVLRELREALARR
jgi:very-short-patch-repair endonuclease